MYRVPCSSMGFALLYGCAVGLGGRTSGVHLILGQAFALVTGEAVCVGYRGAWGHG